MRKTLIIFIILLTITQAQASSNKYDIAFSKFKLEWYSVMGIRGSDGQRLKLAFKNTSDKVLKYVKVYYWGVNAVNDIATDRLGRSDFSVNCTGPFKPNKSNKLEVEIALFNPNLLIAYPYKLEITNMDGETVEIEISKGNLHQIFPSIEYIDIGNPVNINNSKVKSTDGYVDDIYE